MPTCIVDTTPRSTLPLVGGSPLVHLLTCLLHYGELSTSCWLVAFYHGLLPILDWVFPLHAYLAHSHSAIPRRDAYALYAV
jgi:hypothetical protein